jgi:hypothetical protein
MSYFLCNMLGTYAVTTGFAIPGIKRAGKSRSIKGAK